MSKQVKFQEGEESHSEDDGSKKRPMGPTSHDPDNCRFYEKDMPDIGDLVYVKVTQVNETSAYVVLLEYDNIEGMIPYTELSRRRIRSIAKLVRVGKEEVAQVIRLDRNKGYIDLSKKQVTPDEARMCEDRYGKAKVVHSIMRHAAASCKTPLAEIQKSITWPLYKKYGHAYDALKEAVTRPDEIFAGLAMSTEIRTHLENTVKLKLKSRPVKIRVDVNVTCFKPEGVDAIRDVLINAKKLSDAEPALPLTVAIVSPPLYCIRTQTENKDEGIQKLLDVVEKMKADMKDKGGAVDVVTPPRVVGEDGEDIATQATTTKQDSSDSGEDA